MATKYLKIYNATAKNNQITSLSRKVFRKCYPPISVSAFPWYFILFYQVVRKFQLQNNDLVGYRHVS